MRVYFVLLPLFYWSQIRKPRREKKAILFKPTSGDWVLTKITNSVKKALEAQGNVVINTYDRNSSPYVFYQHYIPYAFDLKRGLVGHGKGIVWFTHLRQHSCSPIEIIIALNKSALVVFQCEADQELMKEFGFIGKSLVLNGGVDEKWANIDIREIQDCDFDVVISAKFYERKNPLAYRELIEKNPQLRVLFLGSGWEEFSSYGNVRIACVPYEQYFDYYARSKCLVSCSIVEGGPLCILEALACGLPVIMSRTGYFKEFAKQNSVYVIDSSSMDWIGDVERIISQLNHHRGKKYNFDSWDEFGEKFAVAIGKILK